MFWVAGILSKQLAGNSRTFAAMDDPAFLTACGHRTFAVKWVAVCFDATAAAVTFNVTAAGAMQPTA